MRRAKLAELPLLPMPNEGSLHSRLYSALRGAMVEGRLRGGERLPSTRDLAAQLGVARGTVVNVFEQLLSEGYLVARIGSGTEVSSELPDQSFPARSADGPTTVGGEPAKLVLSRWASRSGRSPFPRTPQPLRAFHAHVPALDAFPQDVWGKLASRRARRGEMALLRDSDPRGYAPLREAVAEHLRFSRGVRADSDHVVIVSGLQQALEITSRIVLDPGDTAWMEDPGYVGANAVLRARGVRVVPVPVDEEGLRVDVGIARHGRARLAYVTPAHQAPSGVVLAPARRMALLAWAAKAGAVVFEDDYDSEYRYEGRPVPALQGDDAHSVVVHAGSFSKTLFPGLRLGYVVLPDALLDAFVDAKSISDRYAPAFMQAVLADFILEGHFGRHLRRMRMLYGGRREALLDGLARTLGGAIDVVGAPAGLDLALRFVEPIDDIALVASLSRRGISAEALSALYTRPPGRAGLLLGFAAVAERRIGDGVVGLARAFEAIRKPGARRPASSTINGYGHDS